jgi:hypothetical protein
VHGITNVAVIEKGWIGGGNAGRNTTIIRSNYGLDGNAPFYERSMMNSMDSRPVWFTASPRFINPSAMLMAAGALPSQHAATAVTRAERHAARKLGLPSCDHG